MACTNRMATPTNRDFPVAIGSEVFAEVGFGPGDCRRSTRPITPRICDSGMHFEDRAGLAAVTSDAVRMKFADRPIQRRSGALVSLDSGFRS